MTTVQANDLSPHLTSSVGQTSNYEMDLLKKSQEIHLRNLRIAEKSSTAFTNLTKTFEERKQQYRVYKEAFLDSKSKKVDRLQKERVQALILKSQHKRMHAEENILRIKAGLERNRSEIINKTVTQRASYRISAPALKKVMVKSPRELDLCQQSHLSLSRISKVQKEAKLRREEYLTAKSNPKGLDFKKKAQETVKQKQNIMLEHFLNKSISKFHQIERIRFSKKQSQFQSFSAIKKQRQQFNTRIFANKIRLESNCESKAEKLEESRNRRSNFIEDSKNQYLEEIKSKLQTRRQKSFHILRKNLEKVTREKTSKLDSTYEACVKSKVKIDEAQKKLQLLRQSHMADRYHKIRG